MPCCFQRSALCREGAAGGGAERWGAARGLGVHLRMGEGVKGFICEEEGGGFRPLSTKYEQASS